MLHATAPFYSVLIRINPENPSSTTDYWVFPPVLCSECDRPAAGITDRGVAKFPRATRRNLVVAEHYNDPMVAV
jgi:hypothetical protein